MARPDYCPGLELDPRSGKKLERHSSPYLLAHHWAFYIRDRACARYLSSAQCRVWNRRRHMSESDVIEQYCISATRQHGNMAAAGDGLGPPPWRILNTEWSLLRMLMPHKTCECYPFSPPPCYRLCSPSRPVQALHLTSPRHKPEAPNCPPRLPWVSSARPCVPGPHLICATLLDQHPMAPLQDLRVTLDDIIPAML